MSNDPKSGGGPGDFDLDWGDALDDLDDGGKPLGGLPAPTSIGATSPPSTSSRPLYRPPSTSVPPSVSAPPRASATPPSRGGAPLPAGAQPMPALSAPPAAGVDSLFDAMADELPTPGPRAGGEHADFLDFDDDAAGATRVATIPRELIDSLLLARDEPPFAGASSSPAEPSLAEIVAAAPPVQPSRASVLPAAPASSPDADDDSDIDAMLSVLDVGREPALPARPSEPIAPPPPRVPTAIAPGPVAKSLPAPRSLPTPRALSTPPRPGVPLPRPVTLPRPSGLPPASSVEPPAAVSPPVAPERVSEPSPLASLLEPERVSEPPPLASLFDDEMGAAPPPLASVPPPLPSAWSAAPPPLPTVVSAAPPPLPSLRVSAPPPLPERGSEPNPSSFEGDVGASYPSSEMVSPLFPVAEHLASDDDVSFADASSPSLDPSAFAANPALDADDPAEAPSLELESASDVLPTAGADRAASDAAELDALPLDALPLETPALDALPLETPAPDEVARDALPLDALPLETPVPDGVARDVLPLDALPLDTPAPDALALDALSLDVGLLDTPPLGTAGLAAGDAVSTAREPAAEEPAAEEPAAEAPAAELASGTTDEAPLALATAVSGEDVAAPTTPATAPSGAAAAPVRPDRGAATALRTVRTRKPRAERFPLVGRGDDALRARAMLLVDLAERSQGSTRARLLSAAAEKLTQLGRGGDARALWVQAREADPGDLHVLRMLRRDAVSRAAWADVAALLEAEAGLPLEPAERGLVLSALAELRLSRLDDAAGARDAAKAAAEARPAAVAAALLFAEVAEMPNAGASGDGMSATEARERAAGLWTDLPARAALLVDVARAAEHAGEQARSGAAFARAVGADDTAFDAALGAARAARAGGEVGAAAEAWWRASERAGDPRVAGAIRHAAARLMDLGAARPLDALRWLDGAGGVDAARARVEAAARAGVEDVRRDALSAWAASAGGTDRALALVQIADARAAAGDLEGADTALRDAALADPALGTVRVVREVLAREAGDVSRLPLRTDAGADAPGASLVAAAKSVGDSQGDTRERSLLAEAAREGDEPLLVDTLVLDVAAETGDVAELRAALQRRAERVSPGERLGALLALAEFDRSRGDAASAELPLAQAHAYSPGAPIVTRALVQASAEQASAAWLAEAMASVGARAVFAATMAVRASGDDASVAALQRALDAAPGYGPAWWTLESVARSRGDVDLLRGVHEALAAHSVDGLERAGRRVRAALLQPPESIAQAVALYASARAETPGDAVLDDLFARLGTELSPADRAALAEAACEGVDGEWLRAARLRAAAAWEDAGEPARALPLVRAVLAEGPDSFALAVRDRLEIASGAVALVAERRFDAVRNAPDDDARVQALESLAALDLHERRDAGSAVLSLQSLLELAPGHVPSLRVLERHFLVQGRDDELRGVVRKLVTHLADPADVAGWARFAAHLELRAPDAVAEAADDLLLDVASRARLDAWMARRLEAAAQARGASSAQILASRAIAAQMTSPAERASAALRLAELLARTGAPGEAAQTLAAALAEAPEHPMLAEELARLRLDTADPRGAAEALEVAARASRVPRRVVRLWHRAGMLWQDEADDADRALAALAEAAKVDVAHADVFERLAALLEQRGDLQRLAELTAARVAAGGAQSEMVALHERTAAVCEKLGDRAGTAASLRAALALDPDRLDSLRRVADLCAESADWRGAAEANIRIAKLTKELDELRDVFARLGVIYDVHIPDPRRAEAAYRRVLKLAPTDLSALARLARLYEREQQWGSAIEVLQQLAELDPDPDQIRQHRFDLAQAFERLGQPREAEATLEMSRREAPTDPVIVRALAEFYRRHDAHSALAMHLNRAVSDLRQALDADLTDASAWEALVEVFGWRGRRDAARVAASAAQALGIVLGDDAAQAGAGGVVPGAGAAAVAPEIDELLASAGPLSSAARQVFALAGDAIDKTVPPLDLKAARAERVSLRDLAFRAQLEELARTFGASEVEVWVTPGTPRACTAIGSQPVALLVGRDLLAPGFDAAERAFLLARALHVARLNLVAAVRAQPADLAIAVAGMMRHFDPNYAPPGVSVAALDDAAKRFGKALPRKVRDDLFALVCEMMGARTYDPLRLGAAATELADRVALLVTGAVPSAVSAQLWSAAAETSVRDPRRSDAVRRVAAARALVAFAVSDVHFEARQRTGVDRR